jgi:hypothetical protein
MNDRDGEGFGPEDDREAGPDGDPEEPDEDEESEAPPPSHREPGREEYETGTIRFLVHEPDEVLAVSLEGPRLPGERLPTRIAAKFAAALGEFADAMGAPFAIRGLRFGSVIFDFVPDARTARLFEDAMTSPEFVAETLVDLAEVSPDEDQLLEQVRRLGERPANAYVHLLDVLIEEEVSTTWRATSGRERQLSRNFALSSRRTLEREDEVSVKELTVTGRLYLANANAKTFRLQPDDQSGKIFGRYPPSLESRVGELWSKRVRALLNETVLELVRSGAHRSTYELIDIEEAPFLFDDPPT